jgi:outer membrane protein assembly factor BamA
LDLRAERRSLRSGYSFSSARSYGYSISREEGWAITATDEWIAQWLGSDGGAGSIVADLRGYHRAGSRHSVIAARAALATSWGDSNVRRTFTDSGSGPQPIGFAFDSDAIGLLRGFDDDVRGRHAAVVNADYRFPIRRVERGVGTLPFFLRTIHGALFVDAGHAWDETFHPDDARVSAGAELSADTVLGYSLPLTVTGGVAVRRDGLDRTDSVTVFWRIGRAF